MDGVGRGSGETAGEGGLAVETAALAEEVALTVHPNPTLLEIEADAAEVSRGSTIHLVPAKR